MGFADKKVELLKIVANADEELTGKLIDFAKQNAANSSKFSTDELAMFHETREKYHASKSKTISLEDAHAYIRSLKRK